MTLEFVYGYNGLDNTAPNVFYLADGKVVYYTAAVGVVYDPSTHTQKFFTVRRHRLPRRPPAARRALFAAACLALLLPAKRLCECSRLPCPLAALQTKPPKNPPTPAGPRRRHPLHGAAPQPPLGGHGAGGVGARRHRRRRVPHRLGRLRRPAQADEAHRLQVRGSLLLPPPLPPPPSHRLNEEKQRRRPLTARPPAAACSLRLLASAAPAARTWTRASWWRWPSRPAAAGWWR